MTREARAAAIIFGAEVVAALAVLAAVIVAPVVLSMKTSCAWDIKHPVVGACALVAGVALLVRWAAGGRMSSKTAGMARVLALFLCAAALSASLSRHPQMGMRETWWYAAHVILFLATAIVFRRRAWAVGLIAAILASASFVALSGWTQKFGHDLYGYRWFKSWGDIDVKMRVLGTIGLETAFGGYMATCAVLALGSASFLKSITLRIVLVIGAVGMAVAAVFSGTRSAWFALAVGLLVLAVGFAGQLRRFLAGWKGGSALAVLAAAVIAAAVFVPSSQVSQAWDRIRKAPADLGVRATIWKTALRMFYDSPVVGKGPGTFNSYFATFRPPDYARFGVQAITDRAHCEYLEVLAETGLFGMVPFVIFLGLFAIYSIRALKTLGNGGRRTLLLAVVAAEVTMLVHAAFNIDTRHPPCQMMLWLLIGLAAALWPDEEPAEEPAEGPAEEPAPDPPVSPLVWPVVLGLAAAAFAVAIWTFEIYRPYQARVHLRVAEDRQTTRKYAESIDSARRAVELDPISVSSYYTLGNSLLAARRFQQALLVYHQLNEHAPHYADVDLRMSVIYAVLGRMDRAREAFQVARRHFIPAGFPDAEDTTDDQLRRHAEGYVGGF